MFDMTDSPETVESRQKEPVIFYGIRKVQMPTGRAGATLVTWARPADNAGSKIMEVENAKCTIKCYL